MEKYICVPPCHVGIKTSKCVLTVKEKFKDKINEALSELRPRLQADGGDIELMDVTDGIVKVKLKGACAGCPMSTMTLKMGVETYLKEKIPQVVRVEAVT